MKKKIEVNQETRLILINQALRNYHLKMQREGRVESAWIEGRVEYKPTYGRIIDQLSQMIADNHKEHEALKLTIHGDPEDESEPFHGTDSDDFYGSRPGEVL